jgi:hypothetical protein
MATYSTLHRASVAGAAGLLVALAAAGCAGEDGAPAASAPDDPSSLAEDGTDSNTAETDAEIVTASLVSATATGGTLSLASTELTGGDLGTLALGDAAKAVYFPRACLTVTSDDAARSVTYAFDNCVGPHGILRLTGEIVATYATATGSLVLHLEGKGLQINRTRLDWSATADFNAAGLARTMRWKGALTGTTARGRTFVRTNDKVVTWSLGERCFGLAGVSEGTTAHRYLRTEVTAFRRCQGGCPEAGGKITISNEAKVKVEITYDGTNVATYATPKGTKTVTLACQG